MRDKDLKRTNEQLITFCHMYKIRFLTQNPKVRIISVYGCSRKGPVNGASRRNYIANIFQSDPCGMSKTIANMSRSL
jgi:hypothetical protein